MQTCREADLYWTVGKVRVYLQATGKPRTNWSGTSRRPAAPSYQSCRVLRRRARFAARVSLEAGGQPAPEDLECAGGDPQCVQVLYLAHCSREKGLFDTIAGVLQTNQSLAQIELAVNRAHYQKRVYVLPKHLDEKVARLHLEQIGARLSRLTRKQAQYLGVPAEGPYKSDHYRY